MDKSRIRSTIILTVVLLLSSIVTGHAQAPSVEPTLAETLRIGSLDGELALSYLQDLVVEGGEVYLNQPQEGVVRVFATNGEPLRTLGRTGQGPGEFRRTTFLGFVDDTLTVLDPGNVRVTRMSSQGVVYRTNRIPTDMAVEPPLYWIGDRFPAVDGQLTVSSGTSWRHGEAVAEYPTVLVDETGVIQDTLPSTFHRGLTRRIAGVVFAAPVHRATRWSMSSNGRYYAVADGFPAEVVVQLYDIETQELSRMVLPLPSIPVPAEYADSVARGMYETMNMTAVGGMPFDRFLRELDLPDEALDTPQSLCDGVRAAVG